MAEAVFTLVGAALYVLLLILVAPFLGTLPLVFLTGYLIVAAFDLLGCWREFGWRGYHWISIALGVLVIFPIGSLLWLPWDLWSHLRHSLGRR